MKKFDIELAKKGCPVCTKSGRPVRIVSYDFKSEDHPIVGFILWDNGSETMDCFTIEGEHMSEIDDNHLMMADVKRKGWINIYKSSYYKGGLVFDSKEEAISHRSDYTNCVDTIEIEFDI